MPSLKQITGDLVRLGFVSVTAVTFTTLALVSNARATAADAVEYVRMCSGL